MGLKIQPTRRIGTKITTLIAVFALVMQPMYGLVAERVANAAEDDPVCISGGDCYSTIQSAITAASSDATITVASGTYNESVVINKSITLRGAQAGIDASTRTINGAGESVVDSGTQTAFTISANNVKLDGFQVMQSGSGSHTIITPANYSNITLENNIVTNTTLNGSAMHLYGGQNFTIRQNYFSGIYTGIVLRNGNLATPVATNQKIIDNKFDNVRAMTGGTIVAYGQTDLEIARNDITATFQGISIGATGGAHYMMHNVSVHNNTINLSLPSNGEQPNVYRFGVLVEGMSEGVVIKNNTIKQTGVTPDSTTRYGLIRVSYDDVATTSANPTGLVITENDIESAAGDRAVLVGKNVTNQIDASKNWWGSQANPVSKITSTSATVVSSPWLCQSFTSGSTTSVAGSCVPVDSTPPTFSITNLNNGQIVGTANTNKLVIKGTLTDPSGAYALIQLVKPGVGVVADNVTVHAPVVNDILAEFNTAGLASGAYELHIRPTDYKGNAIPFYVINFNLDTVFPTFAITNPKNGSYVKGIQTIDAEIKDESDITKVLMNIGGISRSWTNGSSSTITRTDDVFSTTVDTSILPEGPVYVTLRGTDGAGNTRYWNNNAKSRQHVFYVDRTAPTITRWIVGGKNYASPYTLTDGQLFNSKNINVQFKDNSKLARVVINDHEIVGKWSNQKSFDAQWYMNQYAKEGPNIIALYDEAGNSTTYEFTLDTTRPTVAVNLNRASYVNSGAIVSSSSKPEIEARDKNFSVVKVFKNGTPINSGWSYNGYEFRLANINWLAEGTYVIRAYDKAGNVSEDFNVTIDDSAPKVDIQGAQDGDTVQGTISLVGLVTDENRMNSHFQITGPNGYSRGFTFRDGQAQHNLSWNTQGLVDGLYTIKFEARDAAGNKDSSTSIKSIKVTVDNTVAAPEITAPGANEYINGSSAVNTWTKPDDISGIVAYQVRYEFDGRETAYRDASKNSRKQTFSGSYQGPITISVRAKDGVGNWSAWSQSVTYIYDSIAPTVTVNPITSSTNTRPKISGSTEPRTTVVVRVGENVIGTVTSDADGNWSIIPEAALSIGNHTVVAVATDAALNTSSADTSSAQSYWTKFAITAPVTGSGTNSGTTTRTVQSVPTNPTPLSQSQFTALLDDTTVATDTTTADTDDGEVAGVSDTNARNSTADDEEKGEVLAAQDSKKSWSVVNLALSIVTVLVGLVSLAGAFTKRKEHENKHTTVRVLTLIPTIGAVIAFFFLENLSLPLGWFNTWTILFGAVLIIQLILASLGKSAQTNE